MSKTEPFYIKKWDKQPYYYVQVKDADGAAVNITGATIRCTMKNADTGSLHIDRQTSGCLITSATLGSFEYRWQSSAETEYPGKYYIEFEITPSSGGKYTIPSAPGEKAVVHIMPSLDEA